MVNNDVVHHDHDHDHAGIGIEIGIAGSETQNNITKQETEKMNVSNLLHKVYSVVDRYVPPQRRAALRSRIVHFLRSRPVLGSFLASQIAISGLPLVVFVLGGVLLTVFALVVGVLVGVSGALVFVLMTLGVTLLALLPTLVVTTFVAVSLWGWAVVGYYVVKWFDERRMPRVHLPFVEGVMQQTGLGGIINNQPLHDDHVGSGGLSSENSSRPEDSLALLQQKAHDSEPDDHEPPTKYREAQSVVLKDATSSTADTKQSQDKTLSQQQRQGTRQSHDTDIDTSSMPLSSPKPTKKKKLDARTYRKTNSIEPTSAVDDTANVMGEMSRTTTAM